MIQPYASAGDVRYKDTNGDGVIDNADRVFSGSAIPTLQLGLNLNAGYKNFDLSMFWQSSLGNKVYNNAKRALESYNGPNNYEADVQPWSPDQPFQHHAAPAARRWRWQPGHRGRPEYSRQLHALA